MADRTLTPARGVLLVRPIETREALPGGRILLTANTRERMTAWQAEVVAVGAFAECDPTRSRAERKCTRIHSYERKSDGTTLRRVHQHTIRAGDWILVEPRSFIAGPDPERSERFVHQDSVWGIFNSETNE